MPSPFLSQLGLFSYSIPCPLALAVAAGDRGLRARGKLVDLIKSISRRSGAIMSELACAEENTLPSALSHRWHAGSLQLLWCLLARDSWPFATAPPSFFRRATYLPDHL